MSNFDQSVVTGVLVQNSEGKFLLVKKPDNVGPYAGMYLPPGGGIDDGENADDVALRELFEETGVRVKNLKRVFFDDDITENWGRDHKTFDWALTIRQIMYQVAFNQPRAMMTPLRLSSGFRRKS